MSTEGTFTAIAEPAWLDDAFESREFYELMQTYRHAPVMDQPAVCVAFEAVKQYCRDVIFDNYRPI
jgi:hypothetical protein